MTPTQCRMARAGLKLSAVDLAKAARVGYATVARFESGKTVQPDMIERLRQTLAAAGAVFNNGGRLVGASVPRAD